MTPYTREQLARQAALTTEDLDHVNQCRRPHNRLGFAYQVGFVRLLNRFPSQQPLEIIDELLTFTGVQLRMDPASIELYSQRQDTVSQHQTRIRDYLGLQQFGEREEKQLEGFLYEECLRREQTSALRAEVQQYLKEHRILQPAISKLDRLIGQQRQKAREHIFTHIKELLSANLIETLDGLLHVGPGGKSPLQSLKDSPTQPSPGAVLRLTEKLDTIRGSGVLDLDLAWLNNNYERSLAKYARRHSIHKLRSREPELRYAALVCFLTHCYHDTVDQLVDMLDKLVNKVSNWAQHQFDEAMRENQHAIRQSVATMQKMAAVVLDDAVDDGEVRAAVFQQVPREQLARQLAEADQWLAGRSSHVFHGVVDRFTYVRQFFPAVLEHLELAGQHKREPSVLQAARLLRELNAEGKRSLPDDPPLDFLPARLRPLVEENGQVSKQAWECALLLSLRDEIKAGNVVVPESKRFGKLDDFFIPKDSWHEKRGAFFERGGLPSRPQDVGLYLTGRLNAAYEAFLSSQPDNTYAHVDDDGWHLSVDPAEKLDEDGKTKLEQLKSWLGKEMRSIRLPELLIEVDNEVQLTEHFLRANNRTIDDVCATLITIMAHGCNIGPYTMSRLTDGVSYSQIKRISDWQLTEDSQRRALADVVGAMSRLGTSRVWGEGKTSSSDGRRYYYPRKVLQQTFSHKMRDYALEFYTFIADNYAPYYSMPIECTDRDAAYVLDGLLYNETDLELEEHYTDTHGYTEINFAAFAMLGKRFCPRIRGLQHQRIYRIDTEMDYGMLTPLVKPKDRKINLGLIQEEWDRIGQFYASLETGHATASIALKRLAGYSKKNRFYRAMRELGRVFKTEFILEYMSQPPLRRRVRRGLLKGEQLHSLAKDVFYAKRGRVSARDLQQQMNSCSCLTLILASIIYWQAKEIERVITQSDPEKKGVDLALLEHVSPIEWDNVLLYGEYVIDRSLIEAA